MADVSENVWNKRGITNLHFLFIFIDKKHRSVNWNLYVWHEALIHLAHVIHIIIVDLFNIINKLDLLFPPYQFFYFPDTLPFVLINH